MLAKRYQAAGCSWNTPQTAKEIIALDPGAAGLAYAVLSHLKGLKSLTNSLQCELAQGYAECLRRRGFGVALHVTDAASVREQILDLARKRFLAVQRKSGLKKAKFKVAALAHLLNKVKDFTDEDDDDESGDNEDEGDGDGERLRKRQKGEMSSIQREAQEYLVGFTMVPPNVMGERLDDFAPVRSWDMCGKRKRASGVCSPLSSTVGGIANGH